MIFKTKKGNCMLKFVNKEQKICTAIIEINPYDVDLEARKILNRFRKRGLHVNQRLEVLIKDLIICELFSKKFGEYRFIGTSKCHNEDKFDEEKGMQIAKSRAKKQYYKYIEHVVERAQKQLEQIIACSRLVTQDISESSAKEIVKIDKLCD